MDNKDQPISNAEIMVPANETAEPKRGWFSRRRFLRRVVQVAIGGTILTGAGIGYGFWEASQIRICRANVTVANLPPSFAGKTIAILADLHHGPLVSIKFIRKAVQIANSLTPDAFALVGDYANHGLQTIEQLPPCLDALSALRAPLGVFAVPGNHDMQNQGAVYRDCIANTSLSDLTNRSMRITLNGEHLWLAGVDDLYWGRPNLDSALNGVPDGAAVVLLSHNPDFAEDKPDPRVGLVLSGHTHGGQIYLPVFGAMRLPSKYGSKYRCGLVQGPQSPVFISRGLGEAGVPLRFNCPPEINVLTLMPATA